MSSATGSSQTYRRLLESVRPYSRWILFSLIATVIHAAVDSAVPLLMIEVIKTIEDVARDRSDAYRLPLLIVLVFPIRGTMDFLAVYGLSWVARSVIRDLRAALFDHYLDLPATFLDRTASGTLIAKITYNTEQIAEAISGAIVVLVRDGFTVIFLFGVMLYISPGLTLWVLVAAPCVGYLVGHMTRAFRRYSTRIQNTFGDQTRYAQQALQGHRVVKLFGGYESEREQFVLENAKNFRLNMRLAGIKALGDSLTQYVVVVFVAALIFFVFAGWLGQSLDAATFFGFVAAVGQLLAPLRRLVNLNVAVQRGLAAAEGIFDALDVPVEQETGQRRIERAEGRVEYHSVSFRYSASEKPALKDVTLTVPAGSSVAIVGHSGSGKSTLVSLLPRFYDATSGAVCLDGVDVRDYRLADLRRQLSLVSQDALLFDDTIANNIAYGALANRSRAAVEEAAHAAYVDEFSEQLPAGLDTPVGERGVLLSGGQRQRIVIARALLKDAPVLILDEATSALDTESEQIVQRALQALMQGRTTLIVAHRLSTVQQADQIVVLKDGVVVEIGKHSELIALGQHYASLYQSSFAD